MNIITAVDDKIIFAATLYILSRLIKVLITFIKERYKTKRLEQQLDVIRLFIMCEMYNNHNIKSEYINEYINNTLKTIVENSNLEIKSSSENNKKESNDEKSNKVKELDKIINLAKYLDGNDE